MACTMIDAYNESARFFVQPKRRLSSAIGIIGASKPTGDATRPLNSHPGICIVTNTIVVRKFAVQNALYVSE